MNKNLDLVAKELYAKIFKYPNLRMVDDEGNDVDTDNVSAARKFTFSFLYKNQDLASITINLNNSEDETSEKFEILISNSPTMANKSFVKKIFLNFAKTMREFAKQHMLTFDIHVITKSNKKRDEEDSIMSESKLFGTSKTSYQRIGEATLIIKHRDYVNQNNPAGRSQRIESIYLENAAGERFLYPHKHLNGARALAQHVSHGGNPYDSVGKYCIGLSEELGKLRMFKSYVDRNESLSETIGNIHNKVIERIEHIKKEIHQLQKSSMYEQFVDQFEEPSDITIPETLVNDWIDRLTIRSFNEELKNVFPYIFKLVDESDIPVKELDASDLIQEIDNDDEEETFENLIPELSEYETFLNRMVESDQEGIFAAENEDALAELNQLISQPLPLGVDGTNVVQSLEGLGFDEDFLNGLQEIAKNQSSEDMDARPFIQEYVKGKDEELGTDVLSQLNFGEETEEPAAEMPPAEEPAAEMPPVEQPVAESSRGTFDELKEFIKSMYNEEACNFPKGIEGVKIACEKKFGDRVGPIAAKIVERMSVSSELARMKKLSGIQ